MYGDYVQLRIRIAVSLTPNGFYSVDSFIVFNAVDDLLSVVDFLFIKHIIFPVYCHSFDFICFIIDGAFRSVDDLFTVVYNFVICHDIGHLIRGYSGFISAGFFAKLSGGIRYGFFGDIFSFVRNNLGSVFYFVFRHCLHTVDRCDFI